MNMVATKAPVARKEKSLTKRQAEVIGVIRDHMEANGAPPTRAEIARILGFRSVNAAEDHLRALARKGAIALSPGTSRGIQLLGTYAPGIPVVAKIQAGTELLAEENIEARLKLDSKLFSVKPSFLVRVNHDEYQAKGISKGDLLAVVKTETVNDNMSVLVKVLDKIQIRRARLTGEFVELKNEVDGSITNVKREQFSFEGEIVGLVRTSI